MNRPQFAGALLALPFLSALAERPAFAAEPGETMASLIPLAKAEGSVVVDGPPIDAVREALTTGFQKRYGISVSYINSGSGASGARVRAERAANKYLLDVFISGSDTPLMTFLPSGWLDKIETALIDPEVTNKRNWKDNHLWYEDPANTIIRTIQYPQMEIAVNAKYVKPKDIPTWKSLLEPKWKGKLLIKDPTTPGTGQSLTSYFYINFGPDFVKRLYKDQNPTLIADSRQAAQFLAQGNYGVWLGSDFSQLDPFMKAGYPIEPVSPSDGPVILTGSFGLICLMNKAPHANAAKLFVNWLCGREGQTAFAKALVGASLRTDLKQDWVPSYERVKARHYYDAYDYKFVTQQRGPALEKVKELLGF